MYFSVFHDMNLNDLNLQGFCVDLLFWNFLLTVHLVKMFKCYTWTSVVTSAEQCVKAWFGKIVWREHYPTEQEKGILWK